MEQERKNHNVLLTVIAAATLLVALVGATFAYFSATFTATKQSITTGELKINATSSIEHNTNIKPTNWDGEDQDAITAENQNDIAVVTLTVDTDGTTIDSASYNIFLDATGIKLNTEQVKVSQDGTMAAREGGALKDINWSLIDNDNGNQLGSGTFETGVSEAGEVTGLLVNSTGKNISISSDSTTHTYKLYIWIQDTGAKQDQLQEMTIDATLRVEAKQGTAIEG